MFKNCFSIGNESTFGEVLQFEVLQHHPSFFKTKTEKRCNEIHEFRHSSSERIGFNNCQLSFVIILKRCIILNFKIF